MVKVKPRKSSTALAAREKARARAEEMTRRNEELIELAAEFFVQDDRINEIDEDAEKKIADLRAQTEKRKTAARREAASIAQRMMATGESKKSVAERLGLSAAELRSYEKALESSVPDVVADVSTATPISQ
jgi:predicted phage gp36 major capsid-like protein